MVFGLLRTITNASQEASVVPNVARVCVVKAALGMVLDFLSNGGHEY